MVISLTYYLIFVTLPLCGGEVEPPKKKEAPGASTLHYCFPREPIKGEKIPKTRTMLIFFDDSEPGIHTSFTDDLAAALYQGMHADEDSAYCILTSASLLQNIVAARTFAGSVHEALVQKIKAYIPHFQDSSMITMEELRKITSKESIFLTEKQNPLLNKDIASFDIPSQLALYTFESSYWHIYEVNQFLYLLIPTNLTEKWNKYHLGLKIDSLKNVSYEELTKNLLNITEQQRKSPESALSTIFTQSRPLLNSYSFTGVSDGQSPVVFGRLNTLDKPTITFVTPAVYTEKSQKKWISSLFATREEYQKANQLEEMPQWAFYIRGHGITDSIVDLSIEDFQAMLNFFEAALLTRLCIISSCFAAGVNIENVYRDHENYAKRATYSFPIILEASYDLTVVTRSPQMKIISGKSPFILNFSHFASEINKYIPVTYQALLPYIFPMLRIPSINIRYLNIPLFRPPKQADFISLFRPIEITKIMSRTRHKPLKISNEYAQMKFPTVAPIILLKTDIIPFIVDLTNMLVMPYFIAGLAGPVRYYFNEIKADSSIDEFIAMFHREYTPQKKFFIKKITLQDKTKFTDALIYSPEAVTDMMAKEVTTNKVIQITFHFWTLELSIKKEPSAKEIEDYKKQLKEFTAELNPSKQAEIKTLEQTIATKLRTQPLRELQKELSLLNLIAENYRELFQRDEK